VEVDPVAANAGLSGESELAGDETWKRAKESESRSQSTRRGRSQRMRDEPSTALARSASGKTKDRGEKTRGQLKPGREEGRVERGRGERERDSPAKIAFPPSSNEHLETIKPERNQSGSTSSDD